MAKYTALLFAFALAGSSRAAEPESRRRQAGDLAIQSRAILSKYCGECHREGSTRSSLSVLDHKQLVNLQSPVSFASRSGARSQILEFLDDGSMPPAGRDRPTAAEIDILKRWIAVKAPGYPKAFDAATTQRALLDDFAQVPEKDRASVRYVSMAHLVPAGTEPPSLKAAEVTLQKAFTEASAGATGDAVKPVDDTATLFRLDLRALGWDTPDLFEKMVEGAAEGKFPMNAYDLILLEYPDAKPITDVRMNQALSEMKQLRPIPYLKADWLSAALQFKSKATPLADELKSLIGLGQAGAKPAAPFNSNFGTHKSVQAEVPPLGAFYPKDVSSPAPPFPKLTLEVIDPKGDKIAQVEAEELFRLKLTPDADGYFFMLMRWSNGEFAVQAVGGGNKLKAGTTRTLAPNKGGGAFRINNLLNGQETGFEHFILFASPDEIPVPTLVKSVHSKFPIWRFIPAEQAKPGSVQRIVTPIEVTKRR
jgi:hypothetical protein